jgi:hypothetical protein
MQMTMNQRLRDSNLFAQTICSIRHDRQTRHTTEPVHIVGDLRVFIVAFEG